MCDLTRKYFHYTEKDAEEIRRRYDKGEEDVRSDVKLIRDWLGKQPHLPRDIDEAVLERMLLKNKFRIEVVKEKLDLHFTSKRHYKDFIASADPLCDPVKTQSSFQVLVALPKLTPSKERVWVLRSFGEDVNYHFDRVLLMWLLCLEVQLRYDYADSDRVILDFDNYGWSRYKTLTPPVVARGLHLVQGVFSARLSGIDIVNPPPFTSGLLQLFKLIFKPKLFNRVKVHNSMESLRNRVPEDCLPMEYGGNLPSLHQLYDEFKQIWTLERDWLLPALRTTSNEELRIGECKFGNPDAFGVEGTFRQLQVD